MRILFLLMIFLLDLRAAYITSDGFKAHCTFAYDHFNPAEVKEGDSIYVSAVDLGVFFHHCHPYIQNPYILVSHLGDPPVPGPYAAYLEDPKIIAWFGHNVEYPAHPKLHPLPVGVANSNYAFGNKKLLTEVRRKQYPRKNLIYMNFSIGTCREERRPLYFQFKDEPSCFHSPIKSPKKYFKDLAQSRFVLSPRGKGIDCFRTWEALYFGAIPVVKSSTLDPLFENLPVIIVDDWSQVTPAFLKQKEREFQGKTFQMEKLTLEYWLDQIQKVAA